MWALSLAAALWIGGRLQHDDGPRVEAARPLARTEPAAPQATPQARDAAGAAEIRAIVRDELARRLPDPRPPSTDADAIAVAAERAPEPAPMTGELAARAEEVSRLLDRAIGAGRWAPEDRRRFAGATGELPPPVVIELERRLHVAINRGTVAIVDGIPPFGPPVQAP